MKTFFRALKQVVETMKRYKSGAFNNSAVETENISVQWFM